MQDSVDVSIQRLEEFIKLSKKDKKQQPETAQTTLESTKKIKNMIKTSILIFQVTNKGNLTPKDFVMAKKGKSSERKCIFSNSST